MAATKEALELILAGQPPGVRRTLWDYDADFDALWRMEDPDGGHAIVVWGDTPIDPVVRPVATEPHLTPFDWAIAARALHPDLRTTVIDLRPDQHDAASYAALRWWRTQREDCVPWLRRLCPSQLVDVDLGGLRALLDARNDPSPHPSVPSHLVEPRSVLKTLPACQVDVGASATHHAVANLIGPLLLLSAPPQRAQPQVEWPNHQQALRQVLVAAGVIDANQRASRKRTARWGEHCRVVLLDDQWHHGWAEWLADCLGLRWNAVAESLRSLAASEGPQCVAGAPTEGVSLWVASSADWLLDRVESALRDNRRPDARLRLRLTAAEPDDVSEVLLLDLRLVQPGSASEKRLLARAAHCARRFADHGAWRAFDAEELDAVLNWAEHGAARPETPSILTILPRLVAHADPTFPVVLFSSTGRHDVLKKLEGYESIMTQFSKPHLMLGPSSDVADRAETSLMSSLEDAQRLAVGRSGLHRVLSVDPNATVDGPFGHAALFLDESGDEGRPPLTVGGVLALFPEQRGESELNAALLGRGIHWGPGGLEKRPDAGIRDQRAGEVLQIAADHRVKLLGVALTADLRIRPETHVAASAEFAARHLDMLHRSVLRALCNYCLLLVLDSNPDSWAILADNRVRPVPSDAGDRARLERFGRRTEPTTKIERIVDAGRRLEHAVSQHITEPSVRDALSRFMQEGVRFLVAPDDPAAIRRTMKVPVLESASLYPLIEDLLGDHRRNPAVDGVRVSEAQACILPEGTAGATSPPARSLHYFADWFVNSVWRARGGVPSERWAAELARAGFVVSYEQPILGLTAVVQAMQERRACSGVARLAGAASWIVPNVKDALVSRCLTIVRECVDGLGGATLVRALLASDDLEPGRIVTWGTDRNGDEYGLIESDLFQGVSHVTRDRVRAADWTPKRGDGVVFRRTVLGGRVVVSDVWRE
jgi:hypothetical protein